MVEATVLAGRYRIEEKLAAGGMGTVWAATDERLGRRVAVKMLKGDLAHDRTFVERFRREARAAAALSHPNVGAVFDYGEADGQHFIVMELIEGRDLARVLREEGPLPPTRAAQICAQICDALDHAHAAGVVHRDIKPANVIVSTGDRVKVTDFGIARGMGDATITATGAVMGTANYISPEQAAGRRIGPPSDIYAVGVVLYEMLTGSVPFTGDSPISVAMRHVSDPMPAPSTLNPDVPERLDHAVSRATRKDPNERYRSAGDMADALNASDDGATAVLEVEGTSTIWPIPGARYDPLRLGKVVLFTLGALGLLAATLLGIRIVSSDDDRDRQNRGGGGAGQTTAVPSPTPSPSPSPSPTLSPTPSVQGFQITEDILGMRDKDAKKVLEEQGFIVETEKIDSEGEKHTVVDVSPPIGETIFPGDTITLYISTGKEPEDEDEDD